jgi:hypothetical protein
MSFDETQIAALKRITPFLSYAQEGGYKFILIEKLQLPEGCKPQVVDALLCPTPREGYESRLYFSSQITGCPQRNWNGNIRVLDRNWYAISWRVPGGLNLYEILLVHLKALRS